MDNYSNQKWVTLYQAALIELEHALIHGRITDARAEITDRLEMLAAMPGLHGYERGAIQDALANLRVVEREEIRHSENEKHRLAQAALEKLKTIAPKIEQLKNLPRDSSTE